jgi:hypothetical protein
MSEEDHLTVQLVVTFLRNLLAVPDPPPTEAMGGRRSRMQVHAARAAPASGSAGPRGAGPSGCAAASSRRVRGGLTGQRPCTHAPLPPNKRQSELLRALVDESALELVVIVAGHASERPFK